MTRGDAFGIGYLSGHIGLGSASNPKIPEICESGTLRTEFRKGFCAGKSDAEKGIRKIGKAPKPPKTFKAKPPKLFGSTASLSKARLMAGK